MKRLFLLLSTAFLLHAAACSQDNRKIEPCEDCELMLQGMPAQISWNASLASPGEPGEPLMISGTIFLKDGKTPAADVVLYVYHTDNKGYYSPSSGQTLGKRHGHLRGWMKTDKNGRYQFSSIRPASYPNRKDPQHIHPIIMDPGTSSYYWIDEYLFEDDPLLTQEVKSKQEKRGGSGIIKLSKNEKGIWTGQRDIILGLNIPNYK